MAITPAQLDVATPAVPCSDECTRAVAVAAPALPPPPVERWDVTNGFLESAQLPEAGSFTFETIAMGLQVRAGIHENVAIHAGMMGIDIAEGAYRNAGMAFGGGIKLGTSISRRAKVAIVAEAAREFDVATLDAGTPWMGRAYAALTVGSPRNALTFNGGVTAIDNGDPRWVTPMLGISSYLGWDKNLGFVLEAQYFRRARNTTKNTTVLAVRFKESAAKPIWLGLTQTRIDVGVLLLDQEAGTSALPWLQAAFGW